MFCSLLRYVGLVQVPCSLVQQGQVLILFFETACLLGDLSFQIII
ncbi:hypothetical protein NM1476_2182 [Neisseria meningitidis NM1476]|nr:hypothetical protein NM1476_2182 [Neisseria meningitidis NM1476]